MYVNYSMCINGGTIPTYIPHMNSLPATMLPEECTQVMPDAGRRRYRTTMQPTELAQYRK